MPYSAMANPPKSRAPNAPTNEPSPGLLPGEEAVRLDSGEDVAITVEQHRMPNGSGMYFLARARVIGADGTTKLDAHGQPIVSEFGHTADATQIDLLGIDAIAKEIALAVLGEAPTTKAPDGGGDPEPVIPWPRSSRLEVSVRNAAKIAAKASRGRSVKGILGI